MFTKTDIDNYFISMQHSYLFLMIFGITCYVFAVVLFALFKKDFIKGIGIAVVSATVILFSSAYIPYKKTDRLRVLNVYNYDMHPERLKGRELNRVTTIQKNLQIGLYVSLFLVIASVGLYIYATNKLNNAILRGMTVGLMFMSIIVAITFYTMQLKTLRYKEGIKEFTKVIFV